VSNINVTLAQEPPSPTVWKDKVFPCPVCEMPLPIRTTREGPRRRCVPRVRDDAKPGGQKSICHSEPDTAGGPCNQYGWFVVGHG
jgi:hypothetical protein